MSTAFIVHGQFQQTDLGVAVSCSESNSSLSKIKVEMENIRKVQLTIVNNMILYNKVGNTKVSFRELCFLPS